MLYFQSEKTGAILVNNDKCDGCKWCIEACPYGAIRYEPEANTVVICDLCDGNPKCKEICPEEAIEFVTKDSEIRKAWTSALKKWIEASKNLINMAEGKGTFDVLEDTKEIMERIEKKYKDLFSKTK
jgi:Fe-S-cluster-containing dehydrogenase component